MPSPRRPTEADRTAPVPAELPEPSTDPVERMALLVLRTACRLDLSRRATSRLCRAVLPPAPAVLPESSAEPPHQRRLRRRVLTALRRRLRRFDRAQVENALGDAVLLDELNLLPPRQRMALWATAVQQRTVTDVASQTGWTPGQVSRLVQAALTSITLRART